MARSAIGWYFSLTSRIVKKFPRLLLIFSESTFTNPLCTHHRAKYSSELCRWSPQLPQSQLEARAYANSFSWCGNFKSLPPP